MKEIDVSQGRRRRRRLVRTIPIIVILYFHVGLLIGKIPRLDRDMYRLAAVDLGVTRFIRWGYVVPHHGAILVWTANVPGSAPEAAEHSQHLEQFMQRELVLVPIKFVAELVLYFTFLGWVRWGCSWLTAAIFSQQASIGRSLLAGALSWGIGWTLLIWPLLLLDYGAPIYSTWAGPGALSWSTPHLPVSFGPGLTISYRPVIETFGLWFFIIGVAALGKAGALPHSSNEAFLASAGLVGSGCIGASKAVVIAIADAARKRDLS
jgi:uncharacterized membrane protein (DUF485 family)